MSVRGDERCPREAKDEIFVTIQFVTARVTVAFLLLVAF